MADTPAAVASVATPTPSLTPAQSAAQDQSTFGQNNAPVPEGTDAVEAEVQAANPTATKAEVKKEAARIKKFKLKVDGEETEESYNLDDEDFLTKQFQMAKVSQKRMQESAALRKQVQGIEQYLASAKGDPKKLRVMIRDMGGDERALAATIIDEEIANSQKSPEQLATEKLQTELQSLKDANLKKEQEYQAKEFERLQAQEYERYDVQIGKTLESAGVPKQPYVIKKMADYMLTALQHGVALTPDEIMPLVKEEMANDIREMLAVAPDEFVENLVGKDVLTRMRKKGLAAAKTKAPMPVKSGIKDSGKLKEEAKDDSSKKVNFRNFFGV